MPFGHGRDAKQVLDFMAFVSYNLVRNKARPAMERKDIT